MGRIRTIKPEFHADEELSSLPAETHLFAGALVNYADDYGYFNANPILVKAGTNPLRTDKTKVEEQMAQLEAIGYIEIRKEGLKQYGLVCNFEKHQRVSHPSPSKLKSKFESLAKSSRNIPEALRPEGNREQGTGNGTEVSKTTSSHPEPAAGAVTKHPDLLIYEAYPRKEGKGAALDAIRKAIARLKKGEDGKASMNVLEAQRFLMRRVLEYERSPVGKQPDKTKIPHPATWFNQKRYDDDQQNWQLVNGEGNGSFNRNHGKTGGNLDAAAQAIAFLEARDRTGADEVRGAEAGAGEWIDAGDVRGGSGALLIDGHRDGAKCDILPSPR